MIASAEPLLSLPEIARLSGVPYRTLSRHAMQGRLPFPVQLDADGHVTATERAVRNWLLDSQHEPRAASEPTQASAGSEERIRVMAARVARGEQLFHPEDSQRVLCRNRDRPDRLPDRCGCPQCVTPERVLNHIQSILSKGDDHETEA